MAIRSFSKETLLSFARDGLAARREYDRRLSDLAKCHGVSLPNTRIDVKLADDGWVTVKIVTDAGETIAEAEGSA
jgi:hypothetical protein